VAILSLRGVGSTLSPSCMLYEQEAGLKAQRAGLRLVEASLRLGEKRSRRPVYPGWDLTSYYPNCEKVEDAPDLPISGSPFHYVKLSKGEAVVRYCEPLATRQRRASAGLRSRVSGEMGCHRLSRRCVSINFV
jgi:hypothetical protein